MVHCQADRLTTGVKHVAPVDHHPNADSHGPPPTLSSLEVR